MIEELAERAKRKKHPAVLYFDYTYTCDDDVRILLKDLDQLTRHALDSFSFSSHWFDHFWEMFEDVVGEIYPDLALEDYDTTFKCLLLNFDNLDWSRFDFSVFHYIFKMGMSLDEVMELKNHIRDFEKYFKVEWVALGTCFAIWFDDIDMVSRFEKIDKIIDVDWDYNGHRNMKIYQFG